MATWVCRCGQQHSEPPSGSVMYCGVCHESHPSDPSESSGVTINWQSMDLSIGEYPTDKWAERCAVCGTTDCPNPYDEAPEPEPATASEPIPAFREVKVVEHGDDLFLTGRWGQVYGVEADAKCAGSSSGHDAPAHGCRCGFYAWPDPDRFAGSDPVAEVELSGRILEGDMGWRAEHVTTKKVVFPRSCARCGKAASKLVVDRTNPAMQRCFPVEAVCDGHPTVGRECSLAEVSERLGCAVEMTEAPKEPFGDRLAACTVMYVTNPHARSGVA